MIFLISFSISVIAEELNNESPLAGVWTYSGCTIKNTSVRGTADFRKDGILVLKITARDDYPVKNNLSGTYRYTVKGNRIETDYKGGYGINEYFFIEGDYLYFSGTVIDEIIDQPEKYFFNWSYRLKRGKFYNSL